MKEYDMGSDPELDPAVASGDQLKEEREERLALGR